MPQLLKERFYQKALFELVCFILIPDKSVNFSLLTGQIRFDDLGRFSITIVLNSVRTFNIFSVNLLTASNRVFAGVDPSFWHQS